jgi:hypothetical protein
LNGTLQGWGSIPVPGLAAVRGQVVEEEQQVVVHAAALIPDLQRNSALHGRHTVLASCDEVSSSPQSDSVS